MDILKIIPSDDLFLVQTEDGIKYQDSTGNRVLNNMTIYPSNIVKEGFHMFDDEISIWSEEIEKTFLINAVENDFKDILKSKEIFHTKNVCFTLEETNGDDFLKKLQDSENIISVKPELIKRSIYPESYFKYDTCKTFAYSIVRATSNDISGIVNILKTFELDFWLSCCVLLEIPKEQIDILKSNDILTLFEPIFGDDMKRCMAAVRISEDDNFHFSVMTYDSMEDDIDYNRYEGVINMYDEYKNYVSTLETISETQNTVDLLNALNRIETIFGKYISDELKNRAIVKVPLECMNEIFDKNTFCHFIYYIKNSEEPLEIKYEKIKWLLKHGASPNKHRNFFNIIDYLEDDEENKKFIEVFREYRGLTLKEELSQISWREAVEKFNFDYTD